MTLCIEICSVICSVLQYVLESCGHERDVTLILYIQKFLLVLCKCIYNRRSGYASVFFTYLTRIYNTITILFSFKVLYFCFYFCFYSNFYCIKSFQHGCIFSYCIVQTVMHLSRASIYQWIP